MLSNMFESTTIPVLEQVVNFTQARHGVLAGNIANIDTPGYKTRDISPDEFQARLDEAIKFRKQRNDSPTFAINAQLAGKEDLLAGDGMDRCNYRTSLVPQLASTHEIGEPNHV